LKFYEVSAQLVKSAYNKPHGTWMWVPVTTEWRILGLRMEITASRYGG